MKEEFRCPPFELKGVSFSEAGLGDFTLECHRLARGTFCLLLFLELGNCLSLTLKPVLKAGILQAKKVCAGAPHGVNQLFFRV